MERYDYTEAVKEDVVNFLNEMDFKPSDYDYDRESAAEKLNELMWNSDSVTGNASGSYTFSRWQAEENLCHNTDLLFDAMAEFECSPNDYKGAEWGDVTIRLYLLNECINDVLCEYDWEEPMEDDEDDCEDE